VSDGPGGLGVPGGEFVAEELTVQVIPQADDEFTCYSCFLVRHCSQIAIQKGAHADCRSSREGYCIQGRPCPVDTLSGIHQRAPTVSN
jgi:hypothetical protein